MPITIKIDTSKLGKVTQLIKEISSPATRRELHRRWGVTSMNWVTENFEREGALTGTKWAKLSPNTVANKGSSKPLVDSGGLRQSFNFKSDEKQVSVGSNIKHAPYHEFGRKGPWVIRPQAAKALRFMTAQGIRFANKVMHPGLVTRRMLPRRSDVSWTEKLKRAALNLLLERTGKR